MESNGLGVVTNIFTTEEIERIEPVVLEKLKKYLDNFLDDYCKYKAAANRLSKYIKLI